MSDATTPRLKVSREGLVLIKSFEGFRPRAVRNEGGAWMIGYGHTASAREGLTVSEADAELLLQYDLLPVVRVLNEQVATPLNQHQFDALASFAISVGVERFLASDVVQRLNDGRLREAADALIHWPEAMPPDAGLRRRSAERALFVADPEAPMRLVDLLIAPTPAPVEASTPEPQPEPGAETVSAALTTVQLQRYSPYAAAMIGPLPGFPEVSATPAPEVETPPADGTEPAASGQGADVVDADEGPDLFEDTTTEPVMRHEVEPEPVRRSSWIRGAYAAMALVGLCACAASAAAFRLATIEHSGDYVLIGGVLALIGALCVGVSSWNLFVQAGRR